MRNQPDEGDFTSPKFTGIRTFLRLPHRKEWDENTDFLIAGIPFDTGQSYRVGARFGPSAIRDASYNLRPYNPVLDVNPLSEMSGFDYGDLSTVPGNIETTYERVVQALTPIYAEGIVPLCMGGDHSVTLGELRAAHKRHGPLSLVQFDAHSDTWDKYYGQEKYTHGTPFRRAAEEGVVDPTRSIQIGMRGPLYSREDRGNAEELGYEKYRTHELLEMGTGEMVDRIHERVGNRPAFVTFDIDFLDPTQAPGTGTPEVAGPSVREALALIRGLPGLNIVGFDCVEVLPAYDHAQLTAITAANVILEALGVIALTRGGSG